MEEEERKVNQDQKHEIYEKGKQEELSSESEEEEETAPKQMEMNSNTFLKEKVAQDTLYEEVMMSPWL